MSKRRIVETIDDLPPSYRMSINYFLMNGGNRSDAVKRAGLSIHMAKDVFECEVVKAEIKRRMALHESKTDNDREFLINFYKSVINAPKEIKIGDGRPSLTRNFLPKNGKDLLNKFTVTEKFRPARKGDDSPEDKLESRTIDYSFRKVSEGDRINAAKELSILLGLREEKSKVDLEQSLIDTLAKRRSQLSQTEEID